MSSSGTHAASPKRAPAPKATPSGGKTRRDGKTAKAPPGASDRGHSLDDANTIRRAGPATPVAVSRHMRGAAHAVRSTPRRATSRAGAAVVKLMPYRHSLGETVATLHYIYAKEHTAEDDWAQDVTGKDPIEIAEQWGIRNDDGRATAHIVFSLPNQDPATEWGVARAAVRECFPNHPYVAALHTDTDHPHVHVVVRMRGYDQRRLHIDRETLHRYRETLARHGRERGIDVEARRYAVPTRPRNRLRVFSEREPIDRQLDRHIAVLQKPDRATPAQVRRACKAIGKHREQLHDGHRRGLMRAVSVMEQHPTLQRAATRLCKVTFKGPRGDRFRARHTQQQRVDRLAASLGNAPVFDRPRETPRVRVQETATRLDTRLGDKDEPPSGLAAAHDPVLVDTDSAGWRARRARRRREALERAIKTLETTSPLTDPKAVRRALHTVKTHHDVMTDAHRTRLLDAGRGWSHGMYRHLVPVQIRGAQRALLGALGRSAQGRDFLKRQKVVDKACDRLETATSPRQQRRLVKKLARHAEDLTRHDRARLAELAPGLAPRQARTLTKVLKRAEKLEKARQKAWKKARAPKTLTEALARVTVYAVQTLVVTVVRDLAADAVRQLRRRREPARSVSRAAPRIPTPPPEPTPPPVRFWNQRRVRAVEAAIEHLEQHTPAQDPAGSLEALGTLTRHHRHLTDAQREKVLAASCAWPLDEVTGPDAQTVSRCQLAVAGILTRGRTGKAFAERHQARQRGVEAPSRPAQEQPAPSRLAMVEKALETLARTSLDDGPAMREAMRPLKVYQGLLKTTHREQLLALAETWDRQDIERNRRQQVSCDRLQKRTDLAPEDKARRIAEIGDTAAAQRRALQRHTAAVERIVCCTEDGKQVHRQFLVGRALRHLQDPPHADPARARRALVTLAEHRAHLTDDHRRTLLGHVEGWARRRDETTEQRLAWWQRVQQRADLGEERKDATLTRVRRLETSERASTQRYSWLAARVIRHGDEGRAFVAGERLEKAFAALATRTPPVPDSRFVRGPERAAPTKELQAREAAIVIRKDVLTLNARQRAEARAQAAALRKDKDASWRTRRQAGKLARALDKTAPLEERAQDRLTRALKTLADREQATDRDWLAARKAFKQLHEFLTPEQRAELGQHAARMAKEPGRGRLARALRRIAERSPPTRERPPAPSRNAPERRR